MKVEIFVDDGLRDISADLLMDNKRMKLFPASHYQQYRWEELRLFCHNYARYGIPTIELIDYLNDVIDGRSAIEIGAGSGDLGFHLNIHMTDSKSQERKSIIKIYENMKQPVIKYPKDVEKIDALDAVKKYNPKVVIGSWVTTCAPKEMSYGSNPEGIREPEILNLVETVNFIPPNAVDLILGKWEKNND